MKKRLLALLACVLAVSMLFGAMAVSAVDEDVAGELDHAALFIDESGKMTAEETADYIVLSAGSDAEAIFANVLSAGAFVLNLEFDYKAADYSAFIIKLTDAENPDISLTFAVDPMEETITYGEETLELSMSGGMLMLKYADAAQLLQDTSSDTSLFTITADDQGNPFDGFSGGVYMTLGFRDVTGKCAVNLKKLQNQALGHRDEYVADQTEPQIVLSGSLNAKQRKGAQLQIPDFEAYDVYSEVTSKTIKVVSPGGQELFSGKFADYSPVDITENGKYDVIYQAEDAYGNVASVTKSVFSNDDVAPELTVSDLEKSEYKLGDTVTIPAYTASDNLDVCFVDVILVLPDSQMYLLKHDDNGSVTSYIKNTDLLRASFGVSDTSFKAEKTGTYMFRFVAYDDIYNRTVIEVPFQVK